MQSTIKHKPTAASSAAALDLHTFFPYRLALLAEETSKAIAEIYSRRFGLSRQEWRILAVLGGRREFAARDLGQATTLDKMQISRALQLLEQKGLVIRGTDPLDRRNKSVRLTAKGRTMLDELSPLVLNREREILSTLSRDDRNRFQRAISRLLSSLQHGSSQSPIS